MVARSVTRGPAPHSGAPTGGTSVWWLFIALASIGALGPFAIDTYLPALPEMAKALAAPSLEVKLTISAFLLGTGLGPLILAPLGDAIGRRPVMITGLVAFIGLSAACALAGDVRMLIVLRFFQAMASGVAMVMTRAVLADKFAGDELSRATSFVMLFFTTAPIIAPIIGGALLSIGSWRLIFWSLCLFGLIALAMARTVDETLPPALAKPYKLRPVLSGYIDILRHPASLQQIIIGGLFSMQFFAMLSSAPFIFIEQFGVTPAQFAMMFAVISAATYVANLLNATLVTRVGYINMLKGAIFALIANATLLLILGITGFGGLIGFFAAMIIIMSIYHIVIASTTAGLMAYQGHRAGAAAAVATFVRFSMGAFGAALPGLLGLAPTLNYALTVALATLPLLFMISRIKTPDLAK